MKKKTRGKRLLSMLLCFVMLLCLVPSVAFAAPAGAQPPTNLSWDGTTAKWENANEDGVVTSVRIDLFNTKDNSYAAAFTDGGIFTSKDYSSYIIPGDTYYFKVQFKYSDNTKSDFVQSENYTASGTYSLSAIQNLTLSADGKMTWTDTQYENRYSRQLFKKSGETWVAVTTPMWVSFNSSSYDWGTSMEAGKTYRASLQAFQGPVPVSNLTYTNECTVSSSSTPDTTAIESIAVTIDAPALGETPDKIPTFTTTPNGDTLDITDVSWYLAPDEGAGYDGESSQSVAADGVFEAGYYYVLELELDTKDGYEVTDATTATVNGNSARVFVSGAEGAQYVMYIFDPLTAAPSVEKYDVWLGETQVTSANKADILGNGTAGYNPDTKTLTLNGYDGEYIYAEQALTIDLADGTTNKITVPVDVDEFGIYTVGECKLTGGGNLEITVENEDYDGIWADDTTYEASDGNLIIDMSGNLTVDANGDGLYSNNDLTISGSGDVAIESGEVGLYTLNGSIYINGSGNLTVDSADDGIWADDAIEISGSGNISITAGNEGIYASAGEIYIDGDGDLIVEAGSYGIDADDSSIYIGGSGNLTVDSADDGIWAAYNIMISDSRNVTVNAVCRSLRPMDGRLILSGSGSVTATSTEGDAVKSNYDGPAVELNGIGSPITFTAGTDTNSQAVYNENESGILVSGYNFDYYSEEGSPDGKTVRYTMNTADITLPIEKTVVKSGNTAPGQTTFTFELLLAVGEDEDANLLFEVIDTAELTMNGAGTQNADLTFSIPKSMIGRKGEFTEHLSLREKQDAGDGWTYSDVMYEVYREVTSVGTTVGTEEVVYLFYDVQNGNQNQEPIEKAAFVNTYTKNADVPSGEDDDTTGGNTGNDNNDPGDDNDGGNTNPGDDNNDGGNNGGNARPGDTDTGNKPNPDTGVLADAPQTGDSSNMFLWIVLSLVSGLALVGTALYGRKKRATK